MRQEDIAARRNHRSLYLAFGTSCPTRCRTVPARESLPPNTSPKAIPQVGSSSCIGKPRRAKALFLGWNFGPVPTCWISGKTNPFPATGKKALTIGCGLGDDAEQLAEWGFSTTAFDVSETAIRACRRRFPDSRVQYVAADLLQPPASLVPRIRFCIRIATPCKFCRAELRISGHGTRGRFRQAKAESCW